MTEPRWSQRAHALRSAATSAAPVSTPAGPYAAPCAPWSHHAAELAVPLADGLERWEENPTTWGMVQDRLMVRLLPGIFVPPDLLGSAVQRALALGCAVGERLQSHHVVAGPSAAWVFLGGDPPERAELLSPAHRGSIPGATVRTARLHPREVETIGGAPVTSPLRTAADLLRFAPDPVARPSLRRLVEGGYVSVSSIRWHLAGLDRYPGVGAARARIDELLHEAPRAA
ncbi:MULTISPECIES: hypothetical protein [Brachybacterium]|uniref:AbiEi antitoxin C-terminal domain-containing protein n=1 Tax=Brachybacterium alimentarium TaxID=47845 RepID=A0A2A3YKQ0_9MICO|nr:MULTISPECIES: hypothetical protein [Brachybacterium]PCC34217.1 hypothetical protein CIK71_06460 [Brachybacterium alimentarium]PCC39880.1 hypothetical protein CIK66_06685 [Brachybacterium alimentarium]RCS67156.1 hypothetical protein CIK81_01955 [Brachybacterium sp. JB7]RCS69814.1 hypothetical protein CIK68_11070 [Brachybacterium alimentarium]RCS77875.1 hypothetical protein CIK72_12950 [Brachybacterium alimentarium]